MSAAQHLAIQCVGLVTSAGLSTEESCAAFRCKINNPKPTRFIDSGGQWIMAHQVPLSQPWRGITKLAKMASMAIKEALHEVPLSEWAQLPLLLCVAEADRPGRHADIDSTLLELVEGELGARFAAESALVAQGRVSVASALKHAREILHAGQASKVLISAVDSLISWPTLGAYERKDRLLTARNSDGFMPGEGAGAIVVGAPAKDGGELICTGIGFGQEAATIDSGEPMRADGMTQAIRCCLREAHCQMHEMDFRVADISGELYYFKESALAYSRSLQKRQEESDLWHPAECIGETGALSGVSILAAIEAACRKSYAKGPNVLVHLSNDSGARAAIALQYRNSV